MSVHPTEVFGLFGPARFEALRLVANRKFAHKTALVLFQYFDFHISRKWFWIFPCSATYWQIAVRSNHITMSGANPGTN
jgi:hypothetical protein